MSISRVVAITGCDSGLGWSLAARTAREGFVTVAGMYNGTETKAAQALRKFSVHPVTLDVTNQDSVTGYGHYVKDLLKNNSELRLHAVVNNAGVMTIGNYEWQTRQIIENTINVNLLGPMRVVSELLPELRKGAITVSKNVVRPRIINVASHCGLHSMPGFGPYSASKAGVLAWTRALRLEHRPHGLTAVAFIPGGFVTSSNLLMSQTTQIEAMLNHLNEEQRIFYGRKIESLAEYLKHASSQNVEYDCMKDENIIETFMKALLDDYPKQVYKVESWRYKFYYTLMNLPLPENINSWIISHFLGFPDPK